MNYVGPGLHLGKKTAEVKAIVLNRGVRNGTATTCMHSMLGFTLEMGNATGATLQSAFLGQSCSFTGAVCRCTRPVQYGM